MADTAMKPYRGPPMTGSAAAAHRRLIVWCKDCRYLAEHYGARARPPRLAGVLLGCQGTCIEVAPCQVLGEPRFHYFSTLRGGQLSALVSRSRVHGGDLRVPGVRASQWRSMSAPHSC
jgi:hypothetical protein